MYSILMDAGTKSYFMEPGELAFHVYSDPANLDIRRRSSRLVQTDIDDIQELETILYNAGFFRGYLDGKPMSLQKGRVYYYDRNPNEVCYAQYLLTRDKRYLELIKKQMLFTLCRIENKSVYFPTAKLDTGDTAVLTYTDRLRMPQELLDKYEGWRPVKMTFSAKCVVNGTFVVD